MKYYKLLVLLLPVQILFSQPDKGIYWGASINVSLLNENNYYEISAPPNLYLHFGNIFNQYIRIEIFGGYIPFSDNWDGFDLGIALKPQVLDKLYISLGYDYYSIQGGTNEPDQAPIYYQKDFRFVGFGIGYFFNKIAFIEFNYLIPSNSDNVYGYNITTNKQLKLISKIKLDFGWVFSLAKHK